MGTRRGCLSIPTALIIKSSFSILDFSPPASSDALYASSRNSSSRYFLFRSTTDQFVGPVVSGQHNNGGRTFEGFATKGLRAATCRLGMKSLEYKGEPLNLSKIEDEDTLLDAMSLVRSVGEFPRPSCNVDSSSVFGFPGLNCFTDRESGLNEKVPQRSESGGNNVCCVALF